MLSLVIMVSFGDEEFVMQGTEVHSSMGGRVVKFMQGASGPHRDGWQLSTCPAISGQSFSEGSFFVWMEMAMGSRVATGGEVLRESDTDKVVVRVLSSFNMLESQSARELLRLD